jgi:hypothetical protein
VTNSEESARKFRYSANLEVLPIQGVGVMAELLPGIVEWKEQRTAEIATVGTPTAQIEVDTLHDPMRKLGEGPRR